jgi:hypothetical protein
VFLNQVLRTTLVLLKKKNSSSSNTLSNSRYVCDHIYNQGKKRVAFQQPLQLILTTNVKDTQNHATNERVFQIEYLGGPNGIVVGKRERERERERSIYL